MKTKKQTSKASKHTVIEIERKYKKEKYTIGALAINGQWICDTMEPHCIDWDKEVKIPGVTAIPEGTYELEMKRSKKFQKIMPYLKFHGYNDTYRKLPYANKRMHIGGLQHCQRIGT